MISRIKILQKTAANVGKKKKKKTKMAECWSMLKVGDQNMAVHYAILSTLKFPKVNSFLR